MINFRKGTGYSLLQSDFRGNVATSGTIVAGAVVRLDPSTGNILLGVNTNATASTNVDLLGFAINSDLDGDVLESGKIAALALDGQSVIDTDQVAEGITAENFPVGTKVSANTAGLVTVAGGSDRVIGVVEGVNQFPGVATTVESAGYTNVSGVAVAGVSTQVQQSIPVLTIKLASA